MQTANLILLGVRQVGKASDFDSDMHRFESYTPCQCYWVECSNGRAAGCKPVASASRFDPYSTHQVFRSLVKWILRVATDHKVGVRFSQDRPMGNWRNWERSRFAFYSQQFESAILHQSFNAGLAQLARASAL